jgi:hypothetical protein
VAEEWASLEFACSPLNCIAPRCNDSPFFSFFSFSTSPIAFLVTFDISENIEAAAHLICSAYAALRALHYVTEASSTPGQRTARQSVAGKGPGAASFNA